VLEWIPGRGSVGSLQLAHPACLLVALGGGVSCLGVRGVTIVPRSAVGTRSGGEGWMFARINTWGGGWGATMIAALPGLLLPSSCRGGT
jgi:hypothetical protein